MRGEAPNHISWNMSSNMTDMEDSFNETKESQRRTDTEESMLESSSAVSENLHTTASTNESDLEPMDISKTASDSDNASNCSSPSSDTKYFCPICDITLTSQHEFTLHIRSHNNDNEIISEKGFICRICSKVLSSSSSLDRHMLVHSGERPFSCKICSVTFTTNGNMHRHMRTHTHKGGENYESDGSTDSNNSNNSGRRKRRLEFNNNKLVDNKRKSDNYNEDEATPRKTKNLNNNNINENLTQKFRCPVCGREDFASLNVLELHLEDNHPDFEVKCTSCNLSFKNHRALNLHRYMVHSSEKNNINNKNLRNSVVGFKDLTFVDFSSEKFPHIARYACEKSLHKPVTGQKFICDNCTLAFPCASALEIHQEACLRKRDESFNDSENPTDLSRKSESSEEDIRRENFFAHLDLQNKSPPCSPTNEETKIKEKPAEVKAPIDSKDLADIQSIISMTSNGSLLQHLRAKPSPELLPVPTETPPREPQEEESQDVFAAEFRKMKLRGEFPCRLCTAVFPNLRALKGHNRAHLTGTGNTGPYRCNMCPHSSVDKAALIRHMRSHNGDRPYECSLCNYAFTTKANCERHLRNRHAKVTREEVKKAIIYHPSEDPTNDDNKLNTSRDEMKRSFFNSSNEEEHQERINSSTPKENRIAPEAMGLLMPKDLGIKIPPTLLPPDLPISFPMHKEHAPFIQVNKELAVLKEKIMPKDEIMKPFNILREKMEESFNIKNNFQSVDGLKQIPEYDIPSDDETEESSQNHSSSYEDYKSEHPIDLSMDVLDLSKKKSPPPVKKDEPVDCTKKTLEASIPPAMTQAALSQLFAQQLLKNPFYATQLSQYYQNPAVFPSLQNLAMPQMPLSPFLFPHTFLNSNAAQEMKDRMLRIQLQSGGTIISDQFSPDRLQSFQPQPVNEMKFSPKEEEIKPPLHINTHLGDSVNKMHSPKPQQKTPDMSHSPNSVKMVIKNGVLMPKQKQRRYRTERPFSCEHCSARFTLRSNMERHIKQQHPQFWSQRQRSGISTAGRKPSGPTPTPPLTTNNKPPYYDLNIPNYDMYVPKMQDTLVNDTKEKVKFAILAQQLKAKDFYNEQCYPSPTKDKPDEDEDALVIDEEDDKSSVKQETKEEPKNDEKPKTLEEKMFELRQMRENEIKKVGDLLKIAKTEEGQDLVPVSRLLDNANSSMPFREFFRREGEDHEGGGVSEEDEEGLVASGSTSEGNGSSGDENKSENEQTSTSEATKKKSAYSLAPNRVSCPYCNRKFPWTSSLRRHILTHTGQKPFKCSHCPLLFTTKSNCDRHLLRKHGNVNLQNSESSTQPNNKNQNYMMRNVPERPYKCSSCPSSTFATLSNLNKHMSCKHTQNDRPPSIEYESHGSSEDERAKEMKTDKDWETQISQSKVLNDQTPQNADLPFKCHLCEGSFSERQEALDHIKDIHVSEFELLMSKGALDQTVTEEVQQNHETEDDDHLRGKFPDYANRKVMCAFCMRRFWSAEDLRRHMRTHTGERPFSCDVCHRKFTLKHSMLRHRKKHNLTNPVEENVMVSGDEEPTQVLYDRLNINNNNIEGKREEKSDDSEGNEGNDLIGNLLGIRDKSIIDQVLVSSADDAAKLLGVNNGQE